ncbi:MAG TPA: hypothetical protein VF572_07110 [Candidatus Saccharimonadales bacterium]
MDYTKHLKLEFRRKFWKILGAAIDVRDADSQDQVGYIEMKAWVLREDVRLYTDQSKQHELLRIHARTIIDFGATYDVYEGSSDTVLYSMRRKGLRSMFIRDRWDIYDAKDTLIAGLQETSSGLALVRRYVGLIPIVGFVAELVLMVAPLTYTITPAGSTVSGARLTHRKNPIIVKMGLDMSDGDGKLDPRIGVSMAALLGVIDATKN